MAGLKDYLDNLPPETVEQLHKRMREEKTSVDASHPPTAYRLEFLSHHAALTGEFEPQGVDWAAIDAELDPLLEPMGQSLLAEDYAL